MMLNLIYLLRMSFTIVLCIFCCVRMHFVLDSNIGTCIFSFFIGLINMFNLIYILNIFRSPLSLNDAQTIDVGRSKPVNMPVSTAYPILIESGSVSSCEQSPKLLDTYQRLSEEVGGAGELQLKEDLADAMLESPGVRESGWYLVIHYFILS